MATIVISVRGRNREALLADPDFVYVGRRCAGWPASPWGNPFKVGPMPRGQHGFTLGTGTDKCPTAEEAVRRFEDYLRRGGMAHPPHNFVMRDRIAELRGKTLGCWCGDWMPGEPEIACHAVVLARLAEGGAI